MILSGHLWNTSQVPLERMLIVAWILYAHVRSYRLLGFLLVYISMHNFCLDILSINLNGIVKPIMIIMHYIPSFNCQFLHHVFWYSVFRNICNVYHCYTFLLSWFIIICNFFYVVHKFSKFILYLILVKQPNFYFGDYLPKISFFKPFTFKLFIVQNLNWVSSIQCTLDVLIIEFD